MTEYAVPTIMSAEVARREAEWSRPGYEIESAIEWRCPICEHDVGRTLIEARGGQRLPSTVIVGIADPVRIPEADDGAPFYGPTSRERRGKGPRRSALHRWEESKKRARRALHRGEYNRAITDHQPIEASRFDSLCTNCTRRLRFRVPLA